MKTVSSKWIKKELRRRNMRPGGKGNGTGHEVWRDDRGVTCRRWNWRQCVRTRITHSTSTAMFVLDGLGTLGADGLRAAEAELTESLARLSPGATFASRLLRP